MWASEAIGHWQLDARLEILSVSVPGYRAPEGGGAKPIERLLGRKRGGRWRSPNGRPPHRHVVPAVVQGRRCGQEGLALPLRIASPCREDAAVQAHGLRLPRDGPGPEILLPDVRSQPWRARAQVCKKAADLQHAGMRLRGDWPLRAALLQDVRGRQRPWPKLLVPAC